jgi:ABC-2 type transport system permease protein
MITLSSFLRALRYEAVRMRTAAYVWVLMIVAPLAAALATLPAAHALSALPGGLGSAEYYQVVWVVDSGRLGAVLPGCIAAAASAWIGASCIDYEYRHGTAVSLFASIPRRGCVLAAKIVVVAVLAVVIEIACAGLAFGTTAFGFLMAGFTRPLPLAAVFAAPTALVSAAVCGVLALLLTVVVRIRVVAVFFALALAAVAEACLAGTASGGTSATAADPGSTAAAVMSDPFGAPAASLIRRLSALVHLPTGSIPVYVFGPVLLGGLLLAAFGAAQGAVGRRRAQ